MAWTPPLPIMGRGARGALVEERGLHVVRKTRECLLGIRFTGKGGADSFWNALTGRYPCWRNCCQPCMRLWPAMLR